MDIHCTKKPAKTNVLAGLAYLLLANYHSATRVACVCE